MKLTYQELIEECLIFYETKMRKRQTFAFLEEYEANQWKSPGELREIQWIRLKALLEHAYKNVPYYHEQLKSRKLTPGDIRSREDLYKLPPLTKQNIRDHYSALISSTVNRSELYKSWSGGSTGEPIQFEFGRQAYERRMAAQYRSNAWVGCNIGDKELHLWGIPSPAGRLEDLKERVRQALLRRKFINCYKFSRERLPQIFMAFNRYRPKILVGYASALHAFSAFVQKQTLTPYHPQSIISTAEMLYPEQKELIEQVLKVPVYNRYGSREVMLIAAECSLRNGLHINYDNIVVEVLKNGEPAGEGNLGEIFVTDLNNYEMPMIRYQIGDTGIATQRLCNCGRGLPLLDQVTGRTYDLIIASDGNFLPGIAFNSIIRKYQEIQQYQVIQESLELIRILLVQKAPLSASRVRLLENDLKKTVLGNTTLQFEFTDEIPLEKSGKRRITISKVMPSITI
ncbi:MAG: phenylacetate--CoA ligase family protein [Candidatus Tectomicrobia bacterium]|nr:phenylacetate--CoA ligase family protein [Candidatus Tectomicrobia bacterium]